MTPVAARGLRRPRHPMPAAVRDALDELEAGDKYMKMRWSGARAR